MADPNRKRKSQIPEKRKKKKYRSDGSRSKKLVDGPGVWVSCVKGKEKPTVGELYDLFDSLASELWPVANKDVCEPNLDSDSSSDEVEVSIEAQITREVSNIKRPRAEQRFANCHTDTPCVIFISCRPPVDPVRLVETHIQNVQRTGITHTRYTHRFVPVSATCFASIPDIQLLCRSVLAPLLGPDSERTYSYKIELRLRNHTSLTRPNLIQAIAECIPDKHTVNLTNPDLFILVEVFKSVCGVSVTKDYYKLHRYNVMELANSNHESSEDIRLH